MENQVPNTVPDAEPRTELSATPPKNSHVSVIVTLAILVIALLAAGYLYALSLKGRQATSSDETKITASSSSTDTDSIEEDLNNTNVDDSDKGIDSIDENFKP